jgi:hypothetical protein
VVAREVSRQTPLPILGWTSPKILRPEVDGYVSVDWAGGDVFLTDGVADGASLALVRIDAARLDSASALDVRIQAGGTVEVVNARPSPVIELVSPSGERKTGQWCDGALRFTSLAPARYFLVPAGMAASEPRGQRPRAALAVDVRSATMQIAWNPEWEDPAARVVQLISEGSMSDLFVASCGEGEVAPTALRMEPLDETGVAVLPETVGARGIGVFSRCSTGSFVCVDIIPLVERHRIDVGTAQVRLSNVPASRATVTVIPVQTTQKMRVMATSVVFDKDDSLTLSHVPVTGLRVEVRLGGKRTLTSVITPSATVYDIDCARIGLSK